MPEITLQPAAVAGIDTEIDQNAPTTAAGTNTSIDIVYATDGDNRDILIKFDLSSIPKGSKIQQATLSLYVDGSISLSMRADVWRILSANSGWTEGGATWNTIDGATAWAGSAGCETAGVDYSSAALNRMTSDFVNGWNTFALEPSEFQALIDVGNYGFRVAGQVRNPTVSRGVNISSSDHATSAQRPKLYIRWIEPSGRLYEYTFNKYDPEKILRDSKGEIVKPNEIRPNKFIFVQGTEMPSGKAHSDLIVDPRMAYIVGVKNDEDSRAVSIESDRNQFADAILQRLTRGV